MFRTFLLAAVLSLCLGGIDADCTGADRPSATELIVTNCDETAPLNLEELSVQGTDGRSWYPIDLSKGLKIVSRSSFNGPDKTYLLKTDIILQQYKSVTTGFLFEVQTSCAFDDSFGIFSSLLLNMDSCGLLGFSCHPSYNGTFSGTVDIDLGVFGALMQAMADPATYKLKAETYEVNEAGARIGPFSCLEIEGRMDSANSVAPTLPPTVEPEEPGTGAETSPTPSSADDDDDDDDDDGGATCSLTTATSMGDIDPEDVLGSCTGCSCSETGGVKTCILPVGTEVGLKIGEFFAAEPDQGCSGESTLSVIGDGMIRGDQPPERRLTGNCARVKLSSSTHKFIVLHVKVECDATEGLTVHVTGRTPNFPAPGGYTRMFNGAAALYCTTAIQQCTAAGGPRWSTG